MVMKWYWEVAVGAAIIAGLMWANVHYVVNPAVNKETARWQSRWDKRDAADAAFNAQRERDERAKEQDWQSKIDNIESGAEAAKVLASRNLSAANAESDRLRAGISSAIARLQQVSADTSTTSVSATGGSAGNLLTQLFSEIDAAAGSYAAEADRARAAGLTCERAYDALRQ